jgi:hypothetical protein
MMATETESWECMEESTPRSESEDSCGITVSDSASRSMSRLGSRGMFIVPAPLSPFVLCSNQGMAGFGTAG